MKTDVHNHAVPESAMELLSRDPVYGVTVDANFHVSGGPEGAYTVEPPFRDPPAKLANLERHGLEAAVVSVDPTFGQFPADAAHLRFTVGGLGRQAEMIRLMGRLRIDVVGEGS